MKQDNFTRTIEGAEAYERWNTEPEDSHYDYEDLHGDKLEGKEDDGDYCGCSDWGCPCSGTKKGGL